MRVLGKYIPKKIVFFSFASVFILVVIGISLFYEIKLKKEKPKNTTTSSKPVEFKSSDNYASDNLKEFNSLKNDGNFEEAFKNCNYSIGSYYSEGNFEKAKKAAEDCMKDVDSKNIPWFIYRSLAYSELALKDNANAKVHFKTAISKYYEVDFMPSNSKDEMQKEVEKL